MIPLILASTSPRRIQLLKMMGLPFKAVKSGYTEDMALPLPPRQLVKFLALGKAVSAGNKYPGSVIIAGDSIVVYKNKVYGKPVSKADAKRMLKLFSNKKVTVLTCLAVYQKNINKKIVKVVKSQVVFKPISPAELNWYIKTGEPMDRAGAFAIQGRGALLIKNISGDFLGAVGLPVFTLAKVLPQFGVSIVSSP